MQLRIGIDLGGTKIEVIALGAAGQELARHRVPTPQGDYAATLAAVVGLVERVERETGRRGTVGVGTPGALSRVSGLIKNANSTCLIGEPLKDDLQALLGREVRVANDANCFALSEAVDGAGRGAQVVFGVILEPLGYLIATFLFMSAMMFITYGGRYLFNLSIGLLFAVTTYVLFFVLLEVSLPRGILAF